MADRATGDRPPGEGSNPPLSPEQHRILAYASAIGSEFDFALLLGAMGLDEEVLAEEIERLVHLKILSERAGGERFAFAEEEFRARIYRSLTESRLRVLHRKIAEVLERMYPHPTLPGTDRARTALLPGKGPREVLRVQPPRRRGGARGRRVPGRRRPPRARPPRPGLASGGPTGRTGGGRRDPGGPLLFPQQLPQRGPPVHGGSRAARNRVAPGPRPSPPIARRGRAGEPRPGHRGHARHGGAASVRGGRRPSRAFANAPPSRSRRVASGSVLGFSRGVHPGARPHR